MLYKIELAERLHCQNMSHVMNKTEPSFRRDRSVQREFMPHGLLFLEELVGWVIWHLRTMLAAL
jgi:hypothetical protein